MTFLLPVALAFVALLATSLWLYVRRRRRVAARLGDAAVLGRLAGGDLVRVPWLRLALVLASGIALALAISLGPGEAAAGEGGTAGRLVLVLDASSSMLAADVAPDRLELERELARTFLRELEGVPIGLVVFAGRAYILSPPTPDPGALELFIDALDPEIVTQTGSSLSAAVRQAASLLAAGGGEGEPNAIVLISDGDAREPLDGIREAAALAERAGIRLYTIGVGTPAGSRVPDVDFATGRTVGFKQEPTGEVAISRLRPDELRQAAEQTGGSYALGTDSGEVAELLDELRSRLGKPSGGGGEGGRTPAYVWLTALALGLLGTEAVSATLRKGEHP